MAKCECLDCGWKGLANKTGSIIHVEMRVSPGEIMPAGQCPKCGKLLDVPDEDVPEHTLKFCLEIAHKRGLLAKYVVEYGVQAEGGDG